VLSSQVIVMPAGTDWGAVIGAGIAAVGTLAGVALGGRVSKRAEADAVKRRAYAEYLTAVAPLLAHFKSPIPPPIGAEEWRILRASRYAAELVGSPAVADLARQLSAAVQEPQHQAGADFSELFGRLVRTMQIDLQRHRPWLRRRP
jgi:hypothetical protein